MKLKKSKKGKALIIFYYAVFGIGILFLITFIMLKVGILVGLAAGFVLGIVCGIIGGELEFTEHINMLRKKHDQKKEEPPAGARIIAFPENHSDSSSS